MSSLIGFLGGLFQAKAAFSRLEVAIFDAVQLQLSPGPRELWVKQLQAINKIHRSPDGKDVNLFVIHNGKAQFPREICFRRDGEFKMAVVDLKSKRSESKLRARVWCVDGHVFSIEYKTSYTVFEQAAHGEWEVSCHIENHPI